MSDSRSGVLSIVRRNWPIVVVATIAGALVAGGLTLARTSAPYTGTSMISVDTVAITGYPRMPKVDAVLAAKSDPEVVAAVARASGVKPAAVAPALKVFGTGNPQTSITISFVADTKETASAGAKAGAEAVTGYAHALSEKQLVMHKSLLDTDKQALADFQKNTAGDASTRMGFLFNLERALAVDTDQYEWLRNAYSYDGLVAVKQASQRTALLQAVLAGVLAGLFMGIVIAAVREFARSRRA